MPWCLRQSTLLVGTILLAVIAVINGFSFSIIGQCCELGASYSFLELARKSLGHRTGTIAQIMVMFYTFASCVTYVVLCGTSSRVPLHRICESTHYW